MISTFLILLKAYDEVWMDKTLSLRERIKVTAILRHAMVWQHLSENKNAVQKSS